MTAASEGDAATAVEQRPIARNAVIPPELAARKIEAATAAESKHSSDDETRGGSQKISRVDLPPRAEDRIADEGKNLAGVCEKLEVSTPATQAFQSLVAEDDARFGSTVEENGALALDREIAESPKKNSVRSERAEAANAATDTPDDGPTTVDSMLCDRRVEIVDASVSRFESDLGRAISRESINTMKALGTTEDKNEHDYAGRDRTGGLWRDPLKTNFATGAELDRERQDEEEPATELFVESKDDRRFDERKNVRRVNAPSNDGPCAPIYSEDVSSFHEAVRTGDARTATELIARGIVKNLDEPDWNVSGDPPLLVAATNHCLPVLSVLLANGCDPAVRSPRGETALHRAIMNGGPTNILQFVDELLKYDCPSAVKEAGGGATALHVLTRQLAHAQSPRNLRRNFEEAILTLGMLAKAGPVNAKDHQGRSALHILASSSLFDNNHKREIETLIRTLLDAGADPALQNDRGETPLHESLECGGYNVAHLLMPHTPIGITSRYGETPLHIAARKNQPEMVAKLLEHGEDPSVQDAGGNTPLHLASARGFHRIVSSLVTSPLAQLERTNDEGLTSLQVAAESGFVNAVRLLLKAGADPSPSVQYHTTTLRRRHPDISVLIDHELSRRRQLAA